MATDKTYQPKCSRRNGGDVFEVESGGEIEVLSGGTLDLQSGATFTNAATETVTGSRVRTGQQRLVSIAGAKVGGTAGWTLAAADNVSLATVAASQAGGKLVIPITGLRVGDTITAFSVVGQIESAGGAVTLDADLRKHTAAAADVADASVGAITQISVTADAIISAAKSGLAEVVAADETFYLVLTATTAGATDIALQGATITVTEG